VYKAKYKVMDNNSSVTMVLHSIVITAVLFVIMTTVFNQKSEIALNRSILVGAVILIYMVLFGHGLPTRLNKNIIN